MNLCAAILKENLEQAESILKQDPWSHHSLVPWDNPEPHKTLPLNVAVLQNSMGFVSLLLNYGANPTSRDSLGRNALQCAIFTKDCNLQLVRLLLSYIGHDEFDQAINLAQPGPYQKGYTLLGIAASKSLKEQIRILVEFGANPHQKDEHGKEAFSYSPDSSISLLLQENDRVNQLFSLIKKGSVSMIKNLLVTMRREEIDQKDEITGITPLLYCSRHRPLSTNIEEIFDLLILAGSNPFYVNLKNKKTILHYVAKSPGDTNSSSDSSHIARLLKKTLELGIDPNAQDSIGNTALHYLCKWADFETIQMLLQHTDHMLVNHKKKTALDECKSIYLRKQLMNEIEGKQHDVEKQVKKDESLPSDVVDKESNVDFCKIWMEMNLETAIDCCKYIFVMDNLEMIKSISNSTELKDSGILENNNLSKMKMEMEAIKSNICKSNCLKTEWLGIARAEQLIDWTRTKDARVYIQIPNAFNLDCDSQLLDLILCYSRLKTKMEKLSKARERLVIQTKLNEIESIRSCIEMIVSSNEDCKGNDIIGYLENLVSRLDPLLLPIEIDQEIKEIQVPKDPLHKLDYYSRETTSLLKLGLLKVFKLIDALDTWFSRQSIIGSKTMSRSTESKILSILSIANTNSLPRIPETINLDLITRFEEHVVTRLEENSATRIEQIGHNEQMRKDQIEQTIENGETRKQHSTLYKQRVQEWMENGKTKKRNGIVGNSSLQY